MNPLKQTKKITFLLSTFIILLSWVIGYIFLTSQFNASINNQISQQYENINKLFISHINQDKKTYALELKKLISITGLSKAIFNKDYNKLSSIVSPVYKNLIQSNNSVEILTFRSKEGITLYRAHKPDFYNDKLNKKRKLIVDTNHFEKSFNGFEVGKLKMTYRVTQPIFYNNKYVGNVEIGLKLVNFTEQLKSIFTIETGVVIKKSYFNIMIKQKNTVINDNYILLCGNDKLKACFKNLNEKSIFTYDNNLFKIKLDIPLKNHLNETLGFLILGLDVSTIVRENRSFMYQFLALMITMTLVLGIVMHYGFEKILKYFAKQTYTDDLTNLENRLALNNKLLLNKEYVLILSNIKNFSSINELYGIDMGNKVLIQVAKIFNDFAKENKFNAFRISSDEYVLLKQEKVFEPEIYIELIDKLHKKISLFKTQIENTIDFISIEIHSGIAFNGQQTLIDAQMALKKAKENFLPYLAYSQNVDTKKEAQNILKIKSLIQNALQNQNIVPFFQPITNQNGDIIKYESLIRMLTFEDGKEKIIFPDDFLEISQKSGQYIEITKQMLNKSLSFFKDRNEKISINLTPSDLFNSVIMDELKKNIKKFDDPKRIVIEITEQEGVKDFQRTIKMIDRLKLSGTLIAIDDFGSGFANYSYILQLKPDYLKIDGSLIKNILTDKDSQILVKSIVNFAKDLNILTIAEYVENLEIFELLKEYGVDEFQGYYFSKPINLLHKD